ncbi:MAG: winged helix-turn-helix transcriptional regulator [Maritimibacter sp.]|nr:winged helix-turn-helix transcriptional regulator [Maritimibacter sp.]
MDPDDFAQRFEALFRETYQLAVRRIADKRARLSPETTGLLLHLTATGPIPVSALAQHTGRAQSTMSEMVAALMHKGLLETDPDPQDARRHLVWLSPAGQAALQEALQVLDRARLAQAAAALAAGDQETILRTWARFNRALSKTGNRHE